MKRRTIVSLALTIFILLGLQFNSVTAFSQMYFSDKLTAGDEFVWDLTYYTVNTEIEYPFMDLESESVITLEILKSPANVDFAQKDYSDFSDYFKLTFGEQIFDFKGDDDPFYWFICPTYVILEGTIFNLVEEEWIYVINDDYLWDEENSFFNIEINNNQVRYVGDTKINEDTIEHVDLIIEQDTGIMIQISIKVESITSEETSYHQVFKRRGVGFSFSVPSSLFAFIIPLVLITVLLRKRLIL